MHGSKMNLFAEGAINGPYPILRIDMIILHEDIIILHVHIIFLHFDIIYLACRGQKYATTDTSWKIARSTNALTMSLYAFILFPYSISGLNII